MDGAGAFGGADAVVADGGRVRVAHGSRVRVADGGRVRVARFAFGRRSVVICFVRLNMRGKKVVIGRWKIFE